MLDDSRHLLRLLAAPGATGGVCWRLLTDTADVLTVVVLGTNHPFVARVKIAAQCVVKLTVKLSVSHALRIDIQPDGFEFSRPPRSRVLSVAMISIATVTCSWVLT
jgi:hypothetical protein